MNDKLGAKIAEGGCSEVHEWESGKIIKLAKANTDVHAMRREFNNNRVAWELGLPVAQPYELLDIEGRSGIVFERIIGEPMMDRFMRMILSPTTIAPNSSVIGIDGQDIRTIAQVLSEIHKHSSLTMPIQRSNLTYSINHSDYLTEAEKLAVIDYMDRLPMKQQLCHGDPNPGNILIRDGQPVIIDWMDASTGNPEADLAEFIVMVRFAVLAPVLPSEVMDYFDSIRELIISIFIDEYMQLTTDISYDDIDSWILPIAARKLQADAVSEEEKVVLVQEIRRRLGVL